MGLFEKFATKEREKERDSGKREEAEVAGPSLKEILANKEDSILFGLYLQDKGEEILGSKLGVGDLERWDYEALAIHRNGFLEVMERSKNISETLTSPMIEKLALLSPELKVIRDVSGTDSIQNALARHVRRLAITDGPQFKSLDRAISDMKAREKAMDEAENEMKKTFREYGISEDEYLALLEGGDASEVARDMEDDEGWWGKLRPMKKVRKAQKTQAQIERLAGMNADTIRRYLRDHEGDMKELGRVFSATMAHPELYKVLVDDLRAEKPEKPEPDMSFGELKTAAKIDEKELESAWEVFHKSHQIEYMENEITESEAIGNFTREYQEKMPVNKRGLWGTIWGQLFSMNVREHLRKATY